MAALPQHSSMPHDERHEADDDVPTTGEIFTSTISAGEPERRPDPSMTMTEASIETSQRHFSNEKGKWPLRVERDYTNGATVCQFWDGWMWELEGRISPTDYQNCMNELNEILASAYDTRINAWYNLLAVLTLYLSTFVISSHYQKQMKQLDKTIDHLNEHKFHPAGLHLGYPRENGFHFAMTIALHSSKSKSDDAEQSAPHQL